MPASSEKQKQTACMALAIKEGKLDGKKFPAAAAMAESMSKEQLEHYCKSLVKE